MTFKGETNPVSLSFASSAESVQAQPALKHHKVAAQWHQPVWHILKWSCLSLWTSKLELWQSACYGLWGKFGASFWACGWLGCSAGSSWEVLKTPTTDTCQRDESPRFLHYTTVATERSRLLPQRLLSSFRNMEKRMQKVREMDSVAGQTGRFKHVQTWFKRFTDVHSASWQKVCCRQGSHSRPGQRIVEHGFWCDLA